MHVALVYNLKKDDIGVADRDSDPSSQHIDDVSTQVEPVTKSADTYAEWDTIETVTAVQNALALRHRVTMIEADEDAFERLRATRPDIVFNIAEGKFGASRESQIPAMLEMLELPYTGSDPLTLAICLDKSRAKEILSYHGVPTPRFSVVSSTNDPAARNVPLPAMVKPLFEGSSKGIFDSSLVRTPEELDRQLRVVIESYRQPALVEQFLSGREFTVALMGNSGEIHVLPIIEVRFDSLPPGVNPIYSYEAKWIWDQSADPLDIFDCPARLTEEPRHAIEETCRRTYRILRCRDWARIDVRLDNKDVPHIIEINPLPGILPNPEDNSCFPKAARAAGMNYTDMLNRVLDIACERYGLQ